jgi:two-component system, NtrC family, response regulator PilR
MTTILIVDDEKSLLELLGVVFKKEGYEVKTNPGTPKAVELIDEGDFDVLLCDIKMPQVDGMDLLRRAKERNPLAPVIMITAYGSVKQAVEALRMGALDYIVKPFDIEELKIIVAHGLEERKLREENVLLKKTFRESASFDNIIGKSKPMHEIFSLIEKTANTDSTVLITGESGTGKEMAARAIHAHSPRADHAFVSVNCAALPENLLESELFGHVKGSFTGAVVDKRGLFETAHLGTIFLDEIAETTTWTQVKLFRVLQDRMIRKVGGTQEISVDVRIIAATNQDLKKRIADGRFREELFYRLNVISFEMPPLRNRVEDIPLLMAYFLRKHCDKQNRRMKRITPEVADILETYPWQGNVRELENLIERIVAVEERETITPACLPAEIMNGRRREDSAVVLQTGFNLETHLDQISKKYIYEAGEQAGGNMKVMAELLGVSYRSLRYLLEKYDIRSYGRAEQRSGNGRNGTGTLRPQ